MRILALALLGSALFAACSPDSGEEALRIQSVSPPPGPLYLNQSIELRFDRPIDTSTVTEDTVRIVDEAGLPVPGRLVTRTRSFYVRFEPLPPLSADLGDGSFRPGRRYRLELPIYPRSNAVRGAAGELLREEQKLEWRAVEPGSLPPDVPTALLAEPGRGPMRLARMPEFDPENGRLLLQFDRPVYPPSVRLDSYRLVRGLGDGEELPLRSVRVSSQSRPEKPHGSSIELRVGRALRPGLHTLWIAPGSRGPTDAALRPLEFATRPDLSLLGAEGERLLPFQVERRREDPLIEERFRIPRIALQENPREIGLPGDVDGMLRWGPDGLWVPLSGFTDWRGMGELVMDQAMTLQTDARIQTSKGNLELGPGDWDFDSIVVAEGQRLHIVLDRTRRIRVRGALRIDGELVLRYGSAVARHPQASSAMGEDPPIGPELDLFWQRFEPRLEVEVAGIVELSGRILVEGQPGALTGYLRAGGPLLEDASRGELRSGLQLLRRQPGDFANVGVPVAGRLAAVSPFFGFADQPEPRGRLRLDGPGMTGLEVLIQALEAGPSGRLSAWLRPERAAELTPFTELRFAILLRPGQGERAGLILRALRFD
jgi:hypothetical protein